MIISNLKIENILSIKEAEIQFDKTGLVLLEGYNYDDNRGNGSGKTAIFNALSFALFDKVPRKITKTEILRNGTKSGSVQCDMLVGTDTYSIKRCRPTKVEYFKNGSRIDIRQEEFEQKIGLTYDQFLITMYTAQGAYDKRFVSLNDSKKKEFILELMNLDKFNSYYKECRDRIKAIDSDNYMNNVKLQGLKSNMQIYKDSLEDEDGINEIISSNNKKIEELQYTITKLSGIKRPDTGRYEQVRERARTERGKIDGARREHSRLTSDLINLERKKQPLTEINPDNECPNCKEPLFTVGKKLLKSDVIEELKNTRIEYNKDIDEKIEVLFKEINTITLNIAKKTKDIDDLLLMLDKKQQDESAEFISASTSIADISINMGSLKRSNSLQQAKMENNKEKKTKIYEILQNAKVISDEINNNNKEKIMISAVGNVFAPTGAPAHIMEDFVNNFNDLIQDNISAIWGNASYSLQTYKVNKDKNVTAKFSESLIINSKERSIGSLSGGEYRSLSLAADFAILDVLKKQFGIVLNPIILDEPFDGLDSIGRETVIELLDRISKDKQIWVIDHASEAKTLFPKIVKVEKRSGISIVSDVL